MYRAECLPPAASKYNACVCLLMLCRLEDYDRNFNFGQNMEMEKEYTMDLPSLLTYKDLNSDSVIPKFTSAAVDAYLENFDKKLEKISTELYGEGYINFVRFSKKQYFFFKAECRAQMKLQVAYTVDVCINEASTVQECQCECAVGMGPTAHCKHVGAVLYGLCKFSECGEFVTVQTCTQKLQTFHQTKKHLGTPVKAENLMVRVHANIDYDPRPPQLVQQEGYETYFKNTVVNSGVMCTAPISQIIYPANPLGILVDHDYECKTDPIEAFLQSQRITEITQTEVDALQQATLGQSANPTWRAERLKRLTSSTYGRICKMLDRTNGDALARSLLADRDINSAPVQHGRMYESEAVKKYEKSTGTVTHECGMFVSCAYPFLCASPDRVINADVLLEVKCPYAAKNKAISQITVPYLEISSGTLALKPNHDYYYQVQGQMLCTGARCVQLVVYTLSDLQIILVERNEEFINKMSAKLQEFFHHFFRAALVDKYLAMNYFNYVLCHCPK